jgi:hypothetical protein
MELRVAKTAPHAAHRKVANHSPQNKTHLTEINKPQVRISSFDLRDLEK